MIKNLKFNIRTTFLFSISCLFCTDSNNINPPKNITNIKPAETIVDQGVSLYNNQNQDQQENTESQNLIETEKNNSSSLMIKLYYFWFRLLGFFFCFLCSFLFVLFSFIILTNEEESFFKKFYVISGIFLLKVCVVFLSLTLFSLNKKWIFFLKMIFEFMCFFALFFHDKLYLKSFYLAICFFFCGYFIFSCIESLYVIALYKMPFFQNFKNNLVVFFSSFFFNLLYFGVFFILRCFKE